MWGAEAWGPAFGSRVRFFESGEVRLAVLSLLAEGPKHGYQLIKEMLDRSGGLYRASAGTVYPTLQQMEQARAMGCDTSQGYFFNAPAPAAEMAELLAAQPV